MKITGRQIRAKFKQTRISQIRRRRLQQRGVGEESLRQKVRDAETSGGRETSSRVRSRSKHPDTTHWKRKQRSVSINGKCCKKSDCEKTSSARVRVISDTPVASHLPASGTSEYGRVGLKCSHNTSPVNLQLCTYCK